MGSLRMHTLNIEAARKHAVDMYGNNHAPPTGGGTSTPYSLNTPDILNSLISITSNPFFESSSPPPPSSTSTNDLQYSETNIIDEDKKVFATLETPNQNINNGISITNSQHHLHQPQILLTLPQPSPVSSVQSLRSQFIKDSLKLTIQTKRKSSGKGELDLGEFEVKIKKKDEVENPNNKIEETSNFSKISNEAMIIKLTPEDEERRKRRRERNKVAATKCRNKKKEKTGLLVLESQTLETNNVTLKSEISKLEEERQRLMDVLSAHVPSCLIKSETNDGVPVRIPSLNPVLPSYNTSANIYYTHTNHNIQQSQRQRPPAQRT